MAHHRGRRRLAVLPGDAPGRTPQRIPGTGKNTPSRCQISPAACARADSSVIAFHPGRFRLALAHALGTSVRPSNHTGPVWRCLTASIFPPVTCAVIATLGNPRHWVWPTGFCPDRWVAGGAPLQCGHLAARQAPPPKSKHLN
ncbi:hypothetical protein NDU88_003639 [Pleurodeles waltl]|uniref:Uncharacterized protein n=1 Tax=Pleurodeles waltl TaxID=8319 RepID=A0AAV7M5W8_PLEWA|nr:hypothetical protein NDU88_003639 [Pleurodeles waltl]